MLSRKSFLYAGTLLTTVFYLMTGAAQAGSGSIVYNIDYVSQFGTTGSGAGQFNFPEQIAIGPDNNLYVIDFLNDNVQSFDKSGNYIASFGSAGTGNGQFTNPAGLAIRNNKIVTADYSANRVQIFDFATQNYIAQVGSSGSGPGQFNAAGFVSIDSNNKIYVGDLFNHRIQVFDQNGAFITQFGTFGSGTGQMYQPIKAAVNSIGNIYVTDQINRNVQIYDSSYNFIGNLGSVGSGNGQTDAPEDIIFDKYDNVYITDTDNHRIQVFDKNGNFLAAFGTAGSGNGQFNTVRGIAEDETGNIWVVDLFNNRVQNLLLTSTETFSSSPPAGNQTAATPLSNLILTGTGTFGDDFIGYNNLDINGTSWTLSGNNNFAGNLALNTGTLTNSGTLAPSGIDIASGATLINSGTLVGAFINNNGTLENTGTVDGLLNNGAYIGAGTVLNDFFNGGSVAPGLGTLTVGGQFLTNNLIDYQVNVNAAGQSSLIAAGDAIQIGGGSVTVTAAPGMYHVNTSYVIMTAVNGVSGTFDTVTSDLAFLNPALDYSDPNQVMLTLTRNDGIDPFAASAGLNFSPYAQTSNQQSTATALSNYSAGQFGGDTAMFDRVQGFSQSDANQILSQIAPDEIAAIPQIQTALISNMQTPLFQRLSALPKSNEATQSFGFVTPEASGSLKPDQVWLQTIGGISNQDSSSSGAAGYRLGVVGARGGVDKDIDKNNRLGLSVAFAHGTADYKNSNDKSATQYTHLDLYGQHQTTNRRFLIEGFLGAGGGRVDTTRLITAGGLNLAAQGNTNAYDVSGAVKLSAPMRVSENNVIIPNITGSASWTRQNAFTETGAAPFNLHLNDITTTPVMLTPMVNWQHIIRNEKYSYNLVPNIGVGATWQLNELSNSMNANFSNATGVPGFTVSGAKQAPIALNITVAVTMQPFSDNKYVPQLVAQTTVQSSSTTTNATASLTAKWEW